LSLHPRGRVEDRRARGGSLLDLLRATEGGVQHEAEIGEVERYTIEGGPIPGFDKPRLPIRLDAKAARGAGEFYRKVGEPRKAADHLRAAEMIRRYRARRTLVQ
jgi:hypothetical protein